MAREADVRLLRRPSVKPVLGNEGGPPPPSMHAGVKDGPAAGPVGVQHHAFAAGRAAHIRREVRGEGCAPGSKGPAATGPGSPAT